MAARKWIVSLSIGLAGCKRTTELDLCEEMALEEDDVAAMSDEQAETLVSEFAEEWAITQVEIGFKPSN